MRDRIGSDGARVRGFAEMKKKNIGILSIFTRYIQPLVTLISDDGRVESHFHYRHRSPPTSLHFSAVFVNGHIGELEGMNRVYYMYMDKKKD